jgi:cell division transport system permease protein
MNTKAIINGAISGIIAVAAIWLFIVWAENYEPALKAVHDSTALLMLFGGLIVLGIAITLFSTHRSVIKYLRMKLDDLY